VDYLVRVGLARLEGASGASEATDKQELGSDEEQPESSGRSEAEEAEAIEMLREAKSELQKARSAVDVLGFTSAEDCTPRGIDRVFVELSTRFHPDRYVGFSAEVRELAQVCFSAIVTAVEEVREPVGYEDAVARLKARERGEHYVTATDQRHARLAFTQSEMLFKNRKWSEAWEPLQLAVDLDPANWRYQLLYQQCAYHVGESTAQQAREALLALNPPAGAARADSLHAVGEILLADGQEEEAYRLYHKALKEHPDHIGAKRRLWLRHKRSQRADANEKSVEPSRSKGVLSGLFGRKK
jgi:tetratricopeptide (TPR) repeat protein